MTYIPKKELYRGDSIDFEINHKRLDITGYSISAILWDSNEHAYQDFGLSVDSTSLTSSLSQDYEIKVNNTTWTITTTASMSYVQISNLLNTEFDGAYQCKIIGFGTNQDIRIQHPSKGSLYSVSITPGDSNDLLTLLNSIPLTAKTGTSHVINKNSSLVDGGSADEIYWIDTRAAYQDFGLSVDASSASSSLAQDYKVIVNDTTYTVTLTLNETYDSIASKLNSELGSTMTCSIVGDSPTQDIRVLHNTSGDSNDVEVEAGETVDLLTMLNSTPETAITGFTNKGWYNIYIDNDETEHWIGDGYIEVSVTDLNGDKTSKMSYLKFKN